MTIAADVKPAVAARAESYRPHHKVRIVTAASLFDGHDAAINIMRRILQASGAEVIHLGHDRSVRDIVDAAVQEDAQGIAGSSYQGGHMEFFRYMVDLLAEAKKYGLKEVPADSHGDALFLHLLARHTPAEQFAPPHPGRGGERPDAASADGEQRHPPADKRDGRIPGDPHRRHHRGCLPQPRLSRTDGRPPKMAKLGTILSIWSPRVTMCSGTTPFT